MLLYVSYIPALLYCIITDAITVGPVGNSIRLSDWNGHLDPNPNYTFDMFFIHFNSNDTGISPIQPKK